MVRVVVHLGSELVNAVFEAKPCIGEHLDVPGSGLWRVSDVVTELGREGDLMIGETHVYTD